MHFIAISLLAILAGTLLLAKTKKEELGKFFTYISWFFIVVGFLLFVAFVAGGICKMKHHCMGGEQGCQKEMMMKDCPPGMHGGACCPEDMRQGCSGEQGKCMKHDSSNKACCEHPGGDAKVMPVPKTEETSKTP